MLPGSLFLCVLLAVLGQCFSFPKKTAFSDFMTGGAAVKECIQDSCTSNRMCVLPPYPDHGTYTATEGLKPGDAVSHTALTYSCEWGYRLIVEGSPICFTGYWFMKTPTCESFKHNASEEDTGHVQSCGRIMSPSGGTESKYTEFPWVVLLFASDEPDDCALTSNNCWFGRCSGSLISPKVVLLTARCVYNYNTNKLKVRAGYRNLETVEAPSIYQEQFVNKKIIHPQYYLQTNPSPYEWNNAALLVMESSYTLDNIAFICLPPPNINIASTSCKVASWNITRSEMFIDHHTLNVFDYNYVDHDKCQRIIIQKWGLNYVLHDSYTCASSAPGKNTCGRHGGAPLMCIAEDHYYARSFVCWSFNCDKANFLKVNTDVVKMRSWIDQEMRANGFTTDTYTHVADRKLTAINLNQFQIK